ncbi:ABC transporter permease [Niameybacter massiliensis]|uniref:ABC transporter permease n=1 Tax=Niameybacter massiliensis TaxID=1658108 RepID=UPI0006B4B42A|nr:ABC transporter permease [Niameybacter massiliensis]
MKSYLDLISISAKMHKRQNRMTLLCIIFAVFLVTAVFSMAEMGIRMEETRLVSKHGALKIHDILGSEMGKTLFPTAIVLFILIMIAGTLMISSSINSNVAQRTKFFGMMRCIGMSKQQIIRFVRLEALNWCTVAIPIGVLLGIVATWGLCAILRFCVGEEFTTIPLFGISIIGIISGVVMGTVTVLIAARTPAKQAAKVSPATAISSNSEYKSKAYYEINTHVFKIETALGIHHAVEVKKKLILMTGSFAISIILFLCFSVLIDFVGYLMPQSYSTADLQIWSIDGSNSIDSELLDNMNDMQEIKHIFGRRSSFDVLVEMNNENMSSNVVDIISYDAFDLDCLTKDNMLKRGSDISKVYGDSNYVLTTWDKDSNWEIGDKIRVGTEKLEIAGLLKCDPFSNDGVTNGKMTIITSDKTFQRLIGETNYSLVMIQMEKGATDENVEAIRNLTDDKYIFRDQRDQRTSGTYIAFVLCIYAFLIIITLVAILNIMNNISMSVSARMKQYGAMRAVGMNTHQIAKMIAAEAFTYALFGCIAGCAIGLGMSKFLYNSLITSHFSYATWSFPVLPIIIILLFLCFAVAAAIYAPLKRIRNMVIIDTINEHNM